MTWHRKKLILLCFEGNLFNRSPRWMDWGVTCLLEELLMSQTNRKQHWGGGLWGEFKPQHQRQHSRVSEGKSPSQCGRRGSLMAFWGWGRFWSQSLTPGFLISRRRWGRGWEQDMWYQYLLWCKVSSSGEKPCTWKFIREAFVESVSVVCLGKEAATDPEVWAEVGS